LEEEGEKKGGKKGWCIFPEPMGKKKGGKRGVASASRGGRKKERGGGKKKKKEAWSFFSAPERRRRGRFLDPKKRVKRDGGKRGKGRSNRSLDVAPFPEKKGKRGKKTGEFKPRANATGKEKKRKKGERPRGLLPRPPIKKGKKEGKEGGKKKGARRPSADQKKGETPFLLRVHQGKRGKEGGVFFPSSRLQKKNPGERVVS